MDWQWTLVVIADVVAAGIMFGLALMAGHYRTARVTPTTMNCSSS
jgi:hypothetical protein